MLVTSIFIKKEIGRPVVYKVKRPGKNCEIFTLYKFRSMTNERDETGELLPDSERMTKIGKFIRKTSIDELPELYNILRGDMSFVGPRPLSVKYIPYYTKEENRRHEVTPGLTGLAQVNGRNNLNWEERFKYDIKYVENIKLTTDLLIILKTIKVSLSRKDVAVRGMGKTSDFHVYRLNQKGFKYEN